MRSGIIVGTGAGLAGGIAAAIVLSILGIKGPHGEIARAITLVSRTVRSESLVVGGLVLTAVATALGALFGVLYEVARLRRESVAFWATLYGIASWIVGWFAVMPPPLRWAPWAAGEDPTLFQLAVAGLLACVGFGAMLAGAFTLFGRDRAATSDARARGLRAVAPSNALPVDRHY
jgi:hypothetical protein